MLWCVNGSSIGRLVDDDAGGLAVKKGASR